jgi:hypothetical protein
LPLRISSEFEHRLVTGLGRLIYGPMHTPLHPRSADWPPSGVAPLKVRETMLARYERQPVEDLTDVETFEFVYLPQVVSEVAGAAGWTRDRCGVDDTLTPFFIWT